MSSQQWTHYYEASLKATYVSVEGEVGGKTGGVVSGGVPGYDNVFSIAVEASSFTGTVALKIEVPTDEEPVYQLFPQGMQFRKPVVVTLDYSLWITAGKVTAGKSYRIAFMNETNETFDELSPPVTFTADAADPVVAFATDHFSRWVIIEISG